MLIEIQGCGTGLFDGKNGEHQAPSDVYFIAHLKNSIISVGQLDECGLEVNIKDGMLHIWDHQHISLQG
jgi:hypothetical protein